MSGSGYGKEGSMELGGRLLEAKKRKVKDDWKMVVLLIKIRMQRSKSSSRAVVLDTVNLLFI